MRHLPFCRVGERGVSCLYLLRDDKKGLESAQYVLTWTPQARQDDEGTCRPLGAPLDAALRLAASSWATSTSSAPLTAWPLGGVGTMRGGGRGRGNLLYFSERAEMLQSALTRRRREGGLSWARLDRCCSNMGRGFWM